MKKQYSQFKNSVKSDWYGATRFERKSVTQNVPSHTQIIYFVGGSKKTIQNVIRIDEGELLILTVSSGKEFLLDKSKVEMVERYVEQPPPKTDK